MPGNAHTVTVHYEQDAQLPLSPSTGQTPGDGSVTLRWTHTDARVHHYEAWRSTTPYFQPGEGDFDCVMM